MYGVVLFGSERITGGAPVLPPFGITGLMFGWTGFDLGAGSVPAELPGVIRTLGLPAFPLDFGSVVGNGSIFPELPIRGRSRSSRPVGV
jgi:hypothetical protein